MMVLALGTNLPWGHDARYAAPRKVCCQVRSYSWGHGARYAPTRTAWCEVRTYSSGHDARFAATLEGMVLGTHLLLGAWCEVCTYSWGHDARYAPTRWAWCEVRSYSEGTMMSLVLGTHLLLGAWCEVCTYSVGMMRRTQLLGGHNDVISARYAPTRSIWSYRPKLAGQQHSHALLRQGQPQGYWRSDHH